MPAFVRVDSYGYGASLTETGLYFIPSRARDDRLRADRGLDRHAARPRGAAANRHGREHGRVVAARLRPLRIRRSRWSGWACSASGIAFALAAIGSLVIEHSEASETGVASGVNMIMRTIGAPIGAQVGAAVISAHTPVGALVPDEIGFTIAFALGRGRLGAGA